jgi:hypothetical protein
MFKSSLNQHTALSGRALPGNILYGASYRAVLLCAEPEQMLLGIFSYASCYSIKHTFLTTNARGVNVYD